jgi:hypothetical protein
MDQLDKAETEGRCPVHGTATSPGRAGLRLTRAHGPKEIVRGEGS